MKSIDQTIDSTPILPVRQVNHTADSASLNIQNKDGIYTYSLEAHHVIILW